jgi:hypothetical protein
MNDFVKHRLALERAWADTESMPIDDIPEPNFTLEVDPSDDLWSDVVRIVVLLYTFAILSMVLA